MSEQVVITGGQGDLGRAIASAFDDDIYIAHAPGRDSLNVNDSANVTAFFKDLERVDLLVCNAAITRDIPFARMSETQWDEVLETNLKGVFLCARAAAQRMIKQRSGHIVLISSYSALHPPAGQANYAAAKAALHGFAKSLAQELGGRNIRINVICPGFMETKMTAPLPERSHQRALSKHTLGRFNTPDRVAAFIRFLHEEMPHTSGQVFNLDSRIV